ncbi:MAG TPA: hypothetical protein VJB93_00065 [Patescibacteria group bacterium]|nr:hypothetical protein [Patescibacteria group bacterium]
MNNVPNTSLVDYLLDLNEEHSTAFISPDVTLARRKYRAEHPTEIAAFKCMDGRLHLPVITETVPGIIQPWRNLGGKFDLGWLGLAASFKDWVDYAISVGRHCLVIVTYHYARGDEHRGCRGFDYDTTAAREFTLNLKKQFEKVFGRSIVYTIQCGIETDADALILHGDNGEIVDCADVLDASDNDVRKMLERLYMEMPERILKDIFPLIKGNIAHIKKVQHTGRLVENAEHQERVLAVGRGFDWLHKINFALIVGPFAPNLIEPIETAALLLKSNIEDGRISKEDGIVLMTSAPYRDPAGPERLLAEEKARFLHNFSLDVITNRVPEIVPYLQFLTTTIDMHTRRVNVLERS